MIFKKIKTLALASLCCTIIKLMPMEMALPQAEGADKAVEAHPVDVDPQIPTQAAFEQSAVSLQSAENLHLKAQWAYFWNYAIAHLDQCPPELLQPLAEKALMKEALIKDNHLSSFFAGALSRKHKRAERPLTLSTDSCAPKDLPESTLQNTHLQPTSVTMPKEPAAEVVPTLFAPEKDAVAVASAHSHKKQKKEKDPIWHYERGGLKKAGIKHHIGSIMADGPPRNLSKSTSALLYEYLKKKGLYFESQELEIFLDKTQGQQK